MKIIIASDSFKGSLSSEEIIDLVSQAAQTVFPGSQTVGFPIADGGEGTVEAIVKASKGEIIPLQVHGPLMEKEDSFYGIIHGNTAVIEMAAASGLPMVAPESRNPLHTTTYGTGELIVDALNRGIRNFSIAIGGSATNDGGMGAMRALGVRFLKADGSELTGTGSELKDVVSIDMSNLHPAVRNSVFTVMCDVDNPLTGPNGATYTFGAQKGADKAMQDELERGMIHYASVLRENGMDVEMLPGAGAAGGLGAALYAFLQAKLQSGIESVLDLIQFDKKAKDADLIITGEGCMDWQSAFGKVPSGVGIHAKNLGIPAIAIVGGVGEGFDKIYEFGIESIFPTVNQAMSIEEAMQHSKTLYKDAAIRALRMIKTGMRIAEKKAEKEVDPLREKEV